MRARAQARVREDRVRRAVRGLKGADAAASVRAEPVTLACHLDSVETVNGRQIVLRGWAEDIGRGEVWLHIGSSAAPIRLNPIISVREDVSAHLRKEGHHPETDRHGFAATATLSGALGPTVHISLVAGPWTAVSAALPIAPQEIPVAAFLHLAVDIARRTGGSMLANLAQILNALSLDPPPPPKVADVRRFGPAAAAPRASIIIPFYGNAFFLIDQLEAQRRAPLDVEWILVSDDPGLTPVLLDQLTRRAATIERPTTLVALGSNGGYAHANNIGAAHAAGQYLLLMNSDVLCDDFGFLDRGVAHLQSHAGVGCVGFSLQFEDGTVQHDGVSFQRVPWLEQLWAGEHLGKGLPVRPDAPSPVDVDAVTGALMLLRRADFASGPVLDPGYHFGDFEDADLCLRVAEQGQSIALLRETGLWHLERQSLRLLADQDGRRAMTTVNCLRFNEKWGAVLDRRTAAERPS